jgi:hypothetical protein
MPTFEIEQYEVHAQTFRVEASSEAEAIKKLLNGQAEPVDSGPDLIEVYHDLGLRARDYPDLVEELRTIGVPVEGEVIPSIRSILEV